MSVTPFRFLHASDFHLERPLLGLPHVPDHLRQLLIDAPYLAAERVFDAALAQDVDFVVLAGDVLHPRAAGPRGIELVRRQLQRLDERQITVYWAAGKADGSGRWPTSIPLPACVHRFEESQVTTMDHRRADQVVATILASGRQARGRLNVADFPRQSTRAYHIAVAHGRAEPESLREAQIDYWALGGRHSPRKLLTGRSLAQYCGSPQGRRETEEGLHGCFLVQVDEDGSARCQMVPTDVVRWQNERIEITAGTTPADLQRILHDRAGHLSETAAGRQLLVTWSIIDQPPRDDRRSEPLGSKLRRGGLADELMEGLRRQFGTEVPGVWTAGLEVAPPQELPSSWYEEDTILGDLLRLVRHYQEHDDEPLEALSAYESEGPFPPELAEAVRISGRRERQDILRRVAILGVDLLRGDHPFSEPETAPV